MTWTMYFGGHEEPHNEDTEKAIAEIGRQIIEELKTHGLSSATFSGNFHSENYLVPKES